MAVTIANIDRNMHPLRQADETGPESHRPEGCGKDWQGYVLSMALAKLEKIDIGIGSGRLR